MPIFIVKILSPLVAELFEAKPVGQNALSIPHCYSLDGLACSMGVRVKARIDSRSKTEIY